MKGLNYNRICKYIVTSVCNGPLHIGNAVGGIEEVLVHPVNGLPFIQAASIAGIFRKCCDRMNPELTKNLFGTAIVDSIETQSRVRFSDGKFSNNIIMELRPHVRINRKRGSVDAASDSGQKFNMEYIGAGAEFVFTIYLYYVEESESFLKTAMEEILAVFQNEGLQFGAKKSSGAGQVFLSELRYKEFDLRDQKGRNEWINEDNLDICEYNRMKKLEKIISGCKAYTVTVKGRTEGSILVKGLSGGFGKNAPNSENIQNAQREYIVPGSSLRGAIRSQMEKIASYLKREVLIMSAFGTANNDDEAGNIGNLIFYDTIIERTEFNREMPLSYRIHIDKFTGGVFQKGLFREKNAAGSMNLKIDIQNRNHPKATLALLILALRDLAIHTMSLGSGYSTGKGMIDVKEIEILRAADQKRAIISFEAAPKITDTKGILETAFDSLKNMGA